MYHTVDMSLTILIAAQTLANIPVIKSSTDIHFVYSDILEP